MCLSFSSCIEEGVHQIKGCSRWNDATKCCDGQKVKSEFVKTGSITMQRGLKTNESESEKLSFQIRYKACSPVKLISFLDMQSRGRQAQLNS